MAAVAVIKQYIGNNHEAMCSLKDLLCQIDMEEVFDCGWPRKLDNLTWCKMPVKLTRKGRAFYEKVV